MAPTPSPSATPAATTASQSSGAGRVVGRVDGEVSIDLETRRLPGVQVLVVGGVIALALAVLQGVGALVNGLPGIVGALLPALLLIGGLLLICGMAFGISPARILRGAGRATSGAAKAGARAAASGAARGAAGGIRGGARMGRSAGGMSTSVTVRRFRVRAMTGELVSCVQQGDLIGDEVRHGDYVLLDGRRTRDGHMLVNRVDVLQTPNGPTLSVVRTRRGPAHSAAIVGDRIALVAGLALLAWAVVTVVRMVQ